MQELTLKPSKGARIAFVVQFAGLAVMFLANLKDIPPRGPGDYFNIAIAVACVYAAIAYPMRAIVFTGGEVRVRNLGGWRTTALPAKVRVQPGLSIGSLYVVDAETKKVVVIVKREFGALKQLEQQMNSWLRRHDRLAES